VIVDSAEDSIKVIPQACYNLPRPAESFDYIAIIINRSPTAGTAYKDTTLEVEEIMGVVQAPEWMQPRMDERILCKASCNINLTYSREIIIAFTVHLSGPNIGYECFDFFVHASTFLNSYSLPPQTPVSWEIWGPQNTRWFQPHDGQALHQALHGQRVAIPCKMWGERESERRLWVRDFNPNAVRRSVYGQMAKGWKCRAVTTPSTTFTEGFYEKNIISSLPYTEIISEETFSTDEAMIGCSQLLLQKVSEP